MLSRAEQTHHACSTRYCTGPRLAKKFRQVNTRERYPTAPQPAENVASGTHTSAASSSFVGRGGSALAPSASRAPRTAHAAGPAGRPGIDTIDLLPVPSTGIQLYSCTWYVQQTASGSYLVVVPVESLEGTR